MKGQRQLQETTAMLLIAKVRRWIMTPAVLVACAAIGLASMVGPGVSLAQKGAVRLSDPAVDGYVEFVDGKQLKAPADRTFIIAALDRLASAVEGLALRQIGPDAAVLSPARKVRHELRLLEPFAADTPERLRNRWKVFTSAAKLVDDLARDLGPRGIGTGLRNAVLRAADSIDYDDPARWQPEALETFFDLTARALRQMADAGSPDDRLTLEYAPRVFSGEQLSGRADQQRQNVPHY